MKIKSILSILSFLAFSFVQAQDNKEKDSQLNNYFNTSLTQDQRQAIYKQIADYSKKIRQAPKDPSNYVNRGVCYANMGMYPDAICDYNKAIKIDSLLPEAYYNRGIARGRFRYTKNACIDIQRAYKLGLAPAKNLFDSKCGIYNLTKKN